MTLQITVKATGKPLKNAGGSHLCKSHNYSHPYTKHSCGHEYCPLAWIACPRCHGSDESNWTIAKKLEESTSEQTYWIKAVLSNDENASDEEIKELFVSEGVDPGEADAWIARRTEALCDPRGLL